MLGLNSNLLDFKSSAPTWFMIFVSEMADDRPCWPSQKKEVDRGSIFQDNPTSCTRMENPSTASPGSLPFGAWLRDTQSSRIQRRHRFVKQASLRRKKWWERTCGMRQFEGATVFSQETLRLQDTHMLHGAGIFTYKTAWFLGQM